MSIDPIYVKLADFGLAKSTLMHGNLEVRLGLHVFTPQHLTNETKSMVGTLNYMAPEIVARAGTYDALVDSFALGATVFAM